MKSDNLIFDVLTVGPLEVNCYIIGSKKDKTAVVFDAGGNTEDILNKLKKYHLTLKFIINTHAHFDHVGGVRALQDATGAKFMIHKDEVPLLNYLNEQSDAFGLPRIPMPKVDITFSDNEELQIDSEVISIIHTPGHSPGSSCFLIDNAVFVGDTLFAGSIGRTDIYGGSHKKIIDSIRTRLFTLDDCIKVYPGHGSFTTIGHEKKHNPFFQ